MNKKAQLGPVTSWVDYILFFLIFTFGIIFLFTYLSLSLTFREDVTLENVGSLRDAENLINQKKIEYAWGNIVDVDKLKRDVEYINTYRKNPNEQESVGLQEI
jgi:hypothetical protein